MPKPRDRIACATVLLAPLIVVLITGGCAGPGKMRVAAQIEDWSREGFSGRRITTEHYTIYSTLRDAELERVLPGFLEASYARYESLFPSRPVKPVKLTTYIFGSRAVWLWYIM